MSDAYRLRYIPGTISADRFPRLRYPQPWNKPYPTRERAEIVKAAMPDPGKWEVVADGE